MNAQELLESLNVLDEHERIEAKRAREIGKSVLETVCAFANEPNLGGGWLLLGVARDDLALFPSYRSRVWKRPTTPVRTLPANARRHSTSRYACRSAPRTWMANR